jgi:hypothetical protein
VWEFEMELPVKGRRRPVSQVRRWKVVGWHTGQYAWELISMDVEQHRTYLNLFAPQYEEMTFISPGRPGETATEYMLRESRQPPSPPVTLEALGVELGSVISDPLVYRAIQAGISQAEFIRILLAENQRLKRSLEDALSKGCRPLFVLESEGNR